MSASRTRPSQPFKGGTLVPSVDIVLSAPLDGAGALLLSFTWPAGVPLGWILWLQVWIADPSGPGHR